MPEARERNKGSDFSVQDSQRPLPLVDLGLVDSILVSVFLTIKLHVAQFLLCMRASHLQARYAIYDVDGQAEAINLVPNGQVERSIDIAFFFVTPYVQVPVVGAPVCQPVYQPGVAMEVKDDGFVDGEQTVEVAVRRPCGCSVEGVSLNRSTTLTKRIFRVGKYWRSITVAASASLVGISPRWL